MTTAILALAFDAYGTLFDVHSVISTCNQVFPEKGPALSQLWRAKQLEYTWLRSLMGRYEDFWQVTESALVFACRSLNLSCPPATRQKLMDAYLHLDSYPEVLQALRSLSTYKLAILSNGSPDMLDAAVNKAGIRDLLDAVLSVELAGVYKQHPRVYQLAVDRLAIPAGAISFQSSNAWDAYAASAFGMRVVWCNRCGQKRERLPGTPDREITSLAELPALVALTRV